MVDLNLPLGTDMAAAESALRAAVAQLRTDPAVKAYLVADPEVIPWNNAPIASVSRSGFLAAVESGVLTHSSMSKTVVRAKVYGETAIVTGRGRNTGTFRGEPIYADEWITDVYCRVDARWVCVLTHLTPAQGD